MKPNILNLPFPSPAVRREAAEEEDPDNPLPLPCSSRPMSTWSSLGARPWGTPASGCPSRGMLPFPETGRAGAFLRARHLSFFAAFFSLWSRSEQPMARRSSPLSDRGEEGSFPSRAGRCLQFQNAKGKMMKKLLSSGSPGHGGSFGRSSGPKGSRLFPRNGRLHVQEPEQSMSIRIRSGFGLDTSIFLYNLKQDDWDVMLSPGCAGRLTTRRSSRTMPQRSNYESSWAVFMTEDNARVVIYFITHGWEDTQVELGFYSGGRNTILTMSVKDANDMTALFQ